MSSDRKRGNSGVVHLVGAGPGDPALATRRALELLRSADVVAHDRLVSSRLIEEAPPQAEIVDVGKRPGGDAASQEEINRLLVERARSGKRVVRLKGGDPFVFGRGGEEAEALADAGVPFEVVPGVTAGVAAASLAGIPVTHREVASAVAFVTGHEDPGKPETALDWDALARFPGTLVFYMGVRNLADVAERLIEHGRAPDEPAAVIERATLPGQRTVGAPLSDLARRAREERVRPPAVTVVGAAAALRERIGWLERRPLDGLTVVVTRARAQASALSQRLAELGAEVVEAPAIRIAPRAQDEEVRAAVERLARGHYDIVCLTSANGVEVLWTALADAGKDARAFAGTTLAAIGPATAEALAAHGLRAEIVPDRAVAEALADELGRTEPAGQRVLVARAAEAREVLPERLREAGADVDVVALYDTLREPLEPDRREAVERADYVTFTSSSTVHGFVEALGGAGRFPSNARVVSIGPVTTAAARELAIEVHAEAERHDVEGLVDALVADAAGR